VRRTVVERAWQGVLVVLLVVTASFILIRLAPGDPFAAALDDPNLTAAMRARWRAAYGLDGSIAEQYVRWWGALVRGDFGWSTSANEPVRSAIGRALPWSLLLMGVSLIIAFGGGMLLGAWQAARAGTLGARLSNAATITVLALPDFWLASVLLLVVAYWWRLAPVGGAVDPLLPLGASWTARLLDALHHLVLPAGTLGLLLLAPVARLQRTALLDKLGSDWVRTARAKGVAPAQVFRRHAWRTALVPMVTLLGVALPALVGGAVFVERIFAWPGMGQLAASAVAARDYHLVVGCVLVGSLAVVVGAALGDLLAARLDPRNAADAA
jgi:peptide/nickel transport system permease protein